MGCFDHTSIDINVSNVFICCKNTSKVVTIQLSSSFASNFDALYSVAWQLKHTESTIVKIKSINSWIQGIIHHNLNVCILFVILVCGFGRIRPQDRAMALDQSTNLACIYPVFFMAGERVDSHKFGVLCTSAMYGLYKIVDCRYGSLPSFFIVLFQCFLPIFGNWVLWAGK